MLKIFVLLLKFSKIGVFNVNFLSLDDNFLTRTFSESQKFRGGALASSI